jgi:hypothetical protein
VSAGLGRQVLLPGREERLRMIDLPSAPVGMVGVGTTTSWNEMLLSINKSIAELEDNFLFLVSRISHASSPTSPVVPNSTSSIPDLTQKFYPPASRSIYQPQPLSSSLLHIGGVVTLFSTVLAARACGFHKM